MRTQPLRVHRIRGHSGEEVIVESLLRKPDRKDPERAELVIARRYCLEEPLTRGRAGTVFQARDELGWIEGQERRVAVQLLDSKLTAGADFAMRFERGVAMLQALDHPGLVRLLDGGRDGDLYYLVFEMPDSGTLRYVLEDVRQLPATEVAAVLRAIGDALQYLHARSFVHGNLTPENVLVTFDYDVKLLDVVPPGLPLVPPAEQDIRADVHGLACLVYEMLTGRHPFQSKSLAEAQRARLKPERISRLSNVEWHALAGALDPEPAERTPTVRQFVEEFGVIDTAELRALIAGDAAGTAAPAPEVSVSWITGSDFVLPRRSIDTGQKKWSVVKNLFLLLLATVCVLTWIYRDQLREAVTALEADIEAWVPPEGTVQAGAPTDSAPAAASPVRSTPATPPASAPTTAPTTAYATVPATTLAAVPPSAAAAGPAQFDFAEPTLRVAESAVAARVIIRRSGDIAESASIVWWTTGGTAGAERDFANLGRRVELFEPGELRRTIFVPLINDAVAEPAEHFNIHLGGPRSESASQVGMRVEIADDD